MVASMESELSKLIKDVFGSSTDSEDDHELQRVRFPDLPNLDEELFLDSSSENPSWLLVTGIDGLWLCRDFLSTSQQSSLLSSIEKKDGSTKHLKIRLMRFGDLPPWAVELSRNIHEAVCMTFLENKIEDMRNNGSEECIMPSNLLRREPFFDQLICNVYQPGEVDFAGLPLAHAAAQ